MIRGGIQEALAKEAEERRLAKVKHEENVEHKVVTLADEMLDEALEIVRSRLGKDGDEAGVKKKMYALGVLDKTTRLLQGNQKLKLDAKEGARNDANFLVELFRKAKSGDIKEEELESVRSAIAPAQDV